MAILVSVALIIPAMATELQVQGSFRARGFYQSNADSGLLKDNPSDAYYDFRFRPELIFKLNDKISMHSRVAIFDENFSNAAGSTTAQWDRGWMKIKTDDFGTFQIGRMVGGLFGLDQFDTERAADRVKWSYTVNDNLSIIALTEKFDESTVTNKTDQDRNGYAVIATYKADNIEAGLLIQQVTDEDDDSATTSTLTMIDGSTYTANVYSESRLYLMPYFKAQFDNIGVFGEINYASGSIEQKNSASGNDYDLSGLGYFLGVNIGLDPVNLEIGYGCTMGDDPSTADEYEAIIGLGSEWTPLVVLQDANALLSNYVVNGVELIYAKADYKLSDDMTLTGIIATAKANEIDIATNTDDDFGMEIDAKLEWKLMDGLTYNFNLGYLSAGDFFKTAANPEPDNTYTLHHQLQIDF